MIYSLVYIQLSPEENDQKCTYIYIRHNPEQKSVQTCARIYPPVHAIYIQLSPERKKNGQSWTFIYIWLNPEQKRVQTCARIYPFVHAVYIQLCPREYCQSYIIFFLRPHYLCMAPYEESGQNYARIYIVRVVYVRLPQERGQS